MSARTEMPDAAEAPERYGSGQAVRRMEDEALLRGQGRYTDDLTLPGMLRAVFVRSAYAHAHLLDVNADAALAMPGVVAVVTGAQLAAAGVSPLPHRPLKRADGSPDAAPPRRALAVDRVRFVGEPVALVLAETLQQARDAAEAVQVDYEELPAITGIAQALAEGAPVLWEEAPDNVAAETRHGDPAAAQAAFAQAAHVVSLELEHPRLSALALEPRTVLAWLAEDGRLMVRMSTQMPSGVRTSLAEVVLHIPREQVRVTVGDVGGGFGMKTGLYPEDAAVAWSAYTLGRPVKWTAERSEEFLAAVHGRSLRSHAELALAADGRILALRVRSQTDIGAYATNTGMSIQLMIGPGICTNVYDIPVIDLRLQAVLTHAAPVGAYRGAGRPEAVFNIERLIDEAARQSGIDRVALRRRNFVRPEQMPYRNAMGHSYDSGRFEDIMNQTLRRADWDGFPARAQHSRSHGLWCGLGIATYLEWTGGATLEERVTVTVLADGVIEVFSAVNGMGQGIATSLAQLVVDVFGVPLSAVRVVLGDTDRGDGFGSAGSRSIFVGGSAMHTGALRALEAARELAAQRLETATADIDYLHGRFQVKGTDMSVDLFELAAAQPQGRIHLESTSGVPGRSWPNACHVCEVELDPATGEVRVVAYTSVSDVGRVINPMIVRGQLDGGAVQGIGQALCERIVYDAESGQLLTGSLMDYAAPRSDLLSTDFVTELDTSIPCLTNPLGVKGCGELGTIGATPCVVNAVADALARAGHAALAPHVQMPLTSARLWEWLQTAQRGRY